MRNLSSLNKALLVLAVALLLCLAPMPYGYYTIIRFVTAILMACVAYVNFREEKPAIGVTAAAIAILFQPFIKLTLGRSMWNVVDVILTVFIVLYVLKKS